MANAQKKTSKYRKIERKWANIKPSKFTKKNHIINIPKKFPYFLLIVCDQGLDSLKAYECLKSLVQLSSVVNVMGGILDSSKVHVKL